MGRKRGVHYKLGSFYRADDRSGFVRRAEQTKMEWQHLIVGRDLWEIRQPQDFVKGVRDDQSVPDARSKLPTPFQGPINLQLALAAAPGATFLYLNSINGVSNGDKIGVMLDSGVYFNTAVSGAPTSAGIPISPALQGYASEGNVVTDYEGPGP